MGELVSREQQELRREIEEALAELDATIDVVSTIGPDPLDVEYWEAWLDRLHDPFEIDWEPREPYRCVCHARESWECACDAWRD